MSGDEMKSSKPKTTASIKKTQRVASIDKVHVPKTAAADTSQSTLAMKVRELSVGEVAKRSGVPISTIHFYERKKLITSRRNDGNQRRYTRDVLRFVSIIKVAQRAGIPLGDIKNALAALPNGRTPNK